MRLASLLTIFTAIEEHSEIFPSKKAGEYFGVFSKISQCWTIIFESLYPEVLKINFPHGHTMTLGGIA